MAEADETIFSNGQDAFDRGDHQATCPFPEEGSERRLWLAGWDEARRYAARSTATEGASARQEDRRPTSPEAH